MLDDIEHHYDKYEWTQDKLTEYREKEKALIEENKKEIAAVLNQSVLLELRRGSNDKT